MSNGVGPDNGPDFSQKTALFVEWFKASATGTRLSTKVELQDLRSENAGRGAVALEDIAEDEELFAVPRSLVLTTATSSIPPSVLESLDETGAWPPLIVTIIYEYLRHERSPWRSYFQVLPTEFDSLMFWNSAELKTLQASAVVNKIGRQGAEESWKETIIPVMLSHPDLFPVPGGSESARTAELIKLAHMAGSLIMAYAFDIDRDDEMNEAKGRADSEDEFEEDDEDEPLKGMVPFADMLNADADRNNARLFQETDYLIMKSTRMISAGQQIFNDYGPLPRSDLLRMYGYLTENYAQYDVVEFSHDLLLEVAGKKHNKKDSVWFKREEQLDELGLLDDGYAIPRPEKDVEVLGDAIPGQIHMLLRALCAQENDNKAAKKPPKDAVQIEEAALLQAVLTKKLSEYGTSLDADHAVLKALRSRASGDVVIPANCSPNRYSMALQVRIGEKEILHQLIHLCQLHIKHESENIATGSTKRKLGDDAEPQSKKVARKDKSRG